ncbi:MAG: hypothetical protein ACJ79V_06635 [Myxococcales bacterium]
MMTSRRTSTFLLAGLLAAACSKGTAPGASGGSSGGTSGGTSGSNGSVVSGIAVPKEISALPAKSGSTSGHVTALRRSALATDLGTDYSSAQTFKFVDEQALSRFSTFNTIFKALSETHYADPENVNKGPYGCMVTWSEDHGGSTPSKQLVPWVVDSKMTVDAAGKDVNEVKVWMQMSMGDGQRHVIQVELDIYEAPTQGADGSYADYGVWKLNAKFDEAATGYFAASSDHDVDGLSVIMLHEMDAKGGGPGQPQGEETKGILKRSEAEGFGVVSFPDYSSCHSPDCQPAPSTVSYAYNANHVALQKGDTVVFKDRASVVDLVNRYGLYDAASGDDVTKTHSFGFPINYTDPQGMQHWGYYGAWQGRHQLGYDGMNAIPEGSTVTRADLPPNAPVHSFTVSKPFTGTLVKRTLVPGDIQGIKDIVVQTFVNKSFQLGYEGSHWLTCGRSWLNLYGGPGSPGAPTCGDGSTPAVFTDFASLALNPSDPQRQVMINYNPPPPPCTSFPCQPPAPTPPQMLVYVANTGFLHTDWTPGPGPMTQPTPTTPFTPAQYDQLWVNIAGPIYISFDGSGFVQKTVASFDQNTFNATFDPYGDRPYTLELDREYYINTPGVNYVVKRTGATTYAVQTELQTVANPVSASTFIPPGTTFRQQWDSSACTLTCPAHPAQSTYAFDAAGMKLVYACVSDTDAQNNVHAGDPVTYGQWGLVAFDASCHATGVQYNWDYPQNGQSWGAQQFLKRADGSYLILEDPIRLASIQLRNHAGVMQTLSLQFDGNWVNGLPDIYNELQKNGFVLMQAIADKVVVIPAGTEVVDANDATRRYLFKPLQMNEYLSIISDPHDVDLTQAAGLDLSTVPSFVDHHIGALPNVPLKYSEGKLIQ